MCAVRAAQQATCLANPDRAAAGWRYRGGLRRGRSPASPESGLVFGVRVVTAATESTRPSPVMVAASPRRWPNRSVPRRFQARRRRRTRQQWRTLAPGRPANVSFRAALTKFADSQSSRGARARSAANPPNPFLRESTGAALPLRPVVRRRCRGWVTRPVEPNEIIWFCRRQWQNWSDVSRRTRVRTARRSISQAGSLCHFLSRCPLGIASTVTLRLSGTADHRRTWRMRRTQVGHHAAERRQHYVSGCRRVTRRSSRRRCSRATMAACCSRGFDAQPAISSDVRMQPEHTPSASKQHRRTQGDVTRIG